MMADSYMQAKLVALASAVGPAVSSLISMAGLGGLSDLISELNKNPAYYYHTC